MRLRKSSRLIKVSSRRISLSRKWLMNCFTTLDCRQMRRQDWERDMMRSTTSSSKKDKFGKSSDRVSATSQLACRKISLVDSSRHIMTMNRSLKTKDKWSSTLDWDSKMATTPSSVATTTTILIKSTLWAHKTKKWLALPSLCWFAFWLPCLQSGKH